VIAGLEATAGDLACRTISEAEIDAIADDHAAMVAAWKAADEAGYFSHNRRIHEAIMAASHNTILANIYESLSGRIQRSRYSAHQTPDQWARAVAEHERMIDLLRARDGAALATLMREHIRGKKSVIAANYGAVEPA
jgi:DNA-binding GntR family transcriptional regulator